MKIFSIAALLVALSASASAFSVEQSRRQAIQAVVGGMATAIAPSVISVLPANAVVSEETPRVVTRMGGLLVCPSKQPANVRRCVTGILVLIIVFVFAFIVVCRNHSKMDHGQFV